MKINRRIPRSFRIGRLAFTLTELLVVVGVVALLMLITLPALAGAGVQTKITQCAANLRQFNSGLQIYANEHEDNLPSWSSASGYWTWDLPWNDGDTLNNFGVDWKAMYCPGTGPRSNDQDNWVLHRYAPPLYRVTGYALTLPNTLTLASSNWNATLTPNPIEFAPGTFEPPPLPSERVLLADATISQPGQHHPSQRFSYNYTRIAGGFNKYHLSPHLNGNFPSGGNLSMLDGHAEWREFEDLDSRTTVSGSTPVFWW